MGSDARSDGILIDGTPLSLAVLDGHDLLVGIGGECGLDCGKRARGKTLIVQLLGERSDRQKIEFLVARDEGGVGQRRGRHVGSVHADREGQKTRVDTLRSEAQQRVLVDNSYTLETALHCHTLHKQ